jgi:hypothetical protein
LAENNHETGAAGKSLTHVGDVIIDDNDILGDGVNIAAHLVSEIDDVIKNSTILR